MSVIRINALDIVEGKGEEFAERFARRAGRVDGAEGFEGLQVLRPTDERTTWLVVTQWRDAASYEAWSVGRTPRDPAKNTLSHDSTVWSFDVLEDTLSNHGSQA